MAPRFCSLYFLFVCDAAPPPHDIKSLHRGAPTSLAPQSPGIVLASISQEGAIITAGPAVIAPRSLMRYEARHRKKSSRKTKVHVATLSDAATSSSIRSHQRKRQKVQRTLDTDDQTHELIASHESHLQLSQTILSVCLQAKKWFGNWFGSGGTTTTTTRLFIFNLFTTTTTTTTTTTKNCAWGHWEAWSECSETCGGGSHQRHRVIAVNAVNGGRQCQGPADQTQDCNEDDCPTTTTTTTTQTTTTATLAPKEEEKKDNTMMFVIVLMVIIIIALGGVVVSRGGQPKPKRQTLDDFAVQDTAGLDAHDDYDYQGQTTDY